MEPVTGRQQWSFDAEGLSGPPRADERHVYVVTQKGSNDTLHALDRSTGQEKWSKRLSGSMRVAAIVTYFGTNKVDQGYLSAIDAKTGKLVPAR